MKGNCAGKGAKEMTAEQREAMRAKMLKEAMAKRQKTGGKYGPKPPVEDMD